MDWKEKLKQLGLGLGTSDTKPVSKVTPSPAVKRVYFCLGLDFGTSSTKAVIKMQTVDTAYAIPFFPGIASADLPYLAPTRLWVDEHEILGYQQTNSGGWIEDLKVRLMEKPWDSAPAWSGAMITATPAGLATAYVALTIREVMNWFNKQVKPTLGAVDINWSFNLGIPARDFDAKEIKDAFFSVACAGWNIAAEGNVISLNRAETAVEAAHLNSLSLIGIEKESVNVVPEVAAGVTSYVRSSQQRAGAHLFVDVGATTLDTSLFLLSEKGGEFQYTFLSADVDSNLGALRLHKHRAKQLGELALAKFAASNPLQPIPQTAQDCVPNSTELLQIDTDFTNLCLISIGSVIARAKRKAPNDLSVHDNGTLQPKVYNESIRVLRSGGGMNLPLYSVAIDEVGIRVAPGGKLGLRVKPLETINLIMPDGLNAPGLDNINWSRMAIAYGLSFPFDDIGTFIPPSEVDEPDIPEKVDIQKNLITKDHM